MEWGLGYSPYILLFKDTSYPVKGVNDLIVSADGVQNKIACKVTNPSCIPHSYPVKLKLKGVNDLIVSTRAVQNKIACYVTNPSCIPYQFLARHRTIHIIFLLGSRSLDRIQIQEG